MPHAEPVYSMIYILGFRHREISDAELAKILGIAEDDVIKAWDYWINQGLVRRDGSSRKFLEIGIKRTASLETQPAYSPEEIKIFADENEEIRLLFKTVEQKLGKPLKYSELNLFLSFYEWLRLPTDVIAILLDYCTANGNYSNRYIETVATDWAEKGIFSVEAAENHLRKFDIFRRIMKAFCLPFGRNPSKKELEYMNKWLYEYGFGLDIIAEAAERTLNQTGAAKFAYADKILKNWHKAGVTTVDSIKAADEVFAAPKTVAPKTPPKRKFQNYSGREWDEAKIENILKLENEYLDKRLDGAEEE